MPLDTVLAFRSRVQTAAEPTPFPGKLTGLCQALRMEKLRLQGFLGLLFLPEQSGCLQEGLVNSTPPTLVPSFPDEEVTPWHKAPLATYLFLEHKNL